jgi:ribose transport system permease protein
MRRVLSFDELGVVGALIVLVVVIGAFHGGFLHKDNLLQTLQSACFVAIISFGMVFLLAMTEIDLSVGGIYAMAIIVSAKLMAGGMDPWIAAVLGIGVGAVMGALNGVLASLLRLPLIIITLGTLSAYTGLVTVISNAQSVANVPVTNSFFTVMGGNWLGVPLAAWVALVLVVVLTVVFTKTRFGAMVRAVGSNYQAAAFSGIPAGRIRLYAVALTGALAGISGVLTLAYLQGADPTIGGNLNLQVIAAAIIGGTAISGGTGTVPGALFGALIVAVINTGLIFFSIPTNWTSVVTGAVILIAVGTDSFLRTRRQRRAAAEV